MACASMCSAKVCADELDATQTLMCNQSAGENVSKSTKVPCGCARKRNSAMRLSLLASQSCGHRKLYASSIVASCASAQRKLSCHPKGDLFKRYYFNLAFSLRLGIVLRCERMACYICRIYCRRTARMSAHSFFNKCVCHPILLGACISTG